MNEGVKWIHRDRKENGTDRIETFSPEKAAPIRRYHESFPEYKMTPLAELKNFASENGVGNIYVKDESYRFGLNAFKVLGGSYCLGSYIADRLGIARDTLTYEKITGDDADLKPGEITFVTATDGNHGRGIAWTANRLKQGCVVYMPHGSAAERLNNIKAQGAEASITDMNYDDTVRHACEMSKKNGWVLVQDTAWEGYEDIPTRIMQGYLTMADEAVEQLNGVKPTHIFLQAGVGAMSGALTAYFASLYKKERPVITIVEPDQADCIYQSAKANDGKPHAVTGDLHTIMAGLACGEPCTIGWEILRDYVDNYISMPDYVAAKGMRVLGNPLKGDDRVISGESGASTFGFVAEVLQNPELSELKETLQLDENSVVLCFSTEGDTDKANYRRIVWDGLYPSF